MNTWLLNFKSLLSLFYSGLGLLSGLAKIGRFGDPEAVPLYYCFRVTCNSRPSVPMQEVAVKIA